VIFGGNVSRISQPGAGKLAVTMWATTSSNGVYHSVNEAQDATLCGLKVTPVIINRPTETSILHLTTKQPAGRKLCETCAKAEAEIGKMKRERI
jgi:hypothetical protein